MRGNGHFTSHRHIMCRTTKVFIIGNKNLSEVMDKWDKQDISEISDQIQKKIQIVLKKFRRI